MFKMELMKILSKKILWIGIGAVMVFSFAKFYNAMFVKDVRYATVYGNEIRDGITYEKEDVDYNTILYKTKYERIQKEMKLCGPYIGKELTDEFVTEIVTLWNKMRNLGQTDVGYNTPIQVVSGYFPIFDCLPKEYPQEEDCREISIDDTRFFTIKTDYFYKNVNANKPLIFDYGEGWANLSENLANSLMVGLIVVVVVLATVFSSEHKHSMMGQILSTKYGKNKIISGKITASLLVSMAIFTIITIENLIMYGLVYGFGGRNTDLLLTYWEDDIKALNHAGITVFDLFLSVIICGMVVYAAVSIVTLLISVFCRNEYISGVTSMAIYYVPKVISVIFDKKLPNMHSCFNIILAVLPANIFTLRNHFFNWQWVVSSLSIFGHHIPMQIVIVIVYLLISLIGIKLIHWKFRNTQEI